jgi:hypothetical protein
MGSAGGGGLLADELRFSRRRELLPPALRWLARRWQMRPPPPFPRCGRLLPGRETQLQVSVEVLAISTGTHSSASAGVDSLLAGAFLTSSLPPPSLGWREGEDVVVFPDAARREYPEFERREGCMCMLQNGMQ